MTADAGPLPQIVGPVGCRASARRSRLFHRGILRFACVQISAGALFFLALGACSSSRQNDADASIQDVSDVHIADTCPYSAPDDVSPTQVSMASWCPYGTVSPAPFFAEPPAKNQIDVTILPTGTWELRGVSRDWDINYVATQKGGGVVLGLWHEYQNASGATARFASQRLLKFDAAGSKAAESEWFVEGAALVEPRGRFALYELSDGDLLVARWSESSQRTELVRLDEELAPVQVLLEIDSFHGIVGTVHSDAVSVAGAILCNPKDVCATGMPGLRVDSLFDCASGLCVRLDAEIRSYARNPSGHSFCADLGGGDCPLLKGLLRNWNWAGYQPGVPRASLATGGAVARRPALIAAPLLLDMKEMSRPRATALWSNGLVDFEILTDKCDDDASCTQGQKTTQRGGVFSEILAWANVLPVFKDDPAVDPLDGLEGAVAHFGGTLNGEHTLAWQASDPLNSKTIRNFDVWGRPKVLTGGVAASQDWTSALPGRVRAMSFRRPGWVVAVQATDEQQQVIRIAPLGRWPWVPGADPGACADTTICNDGDACSTDGCDYATGCRFTYQRAFQEPCLGPHESQFCVERSEGIGETGYKCDGDPEHPYPSP